MLIFRNFDFEYSDAVDLSCARAMFLSMMALLHHGKIELVCEGLMVLNS